MGSDLRDNCEDKSEFTGNSEQKLNAMVAGVFETSTQKHERFGYVWCLGTTRATCTLAEWCQIIFLLEQIHVQLSSYAYDKQSWASLLKNRRIEKVLHTKECSRLAPRSVLHNQRAVELPFWDLLQAIYEVKPSFLAAASRLRRRLRFRAFVLASVASRRRRRSACKDRPIWLSLVSLEVHVEIGCAFVLIDVVERAEAEEQAAVATLVCKSDSGLSCVLAWHCEPEESSRNDLFSLRFVWDCGWSCRGACKVQPGFAPRQIFSPVLMFITDWKKLLERTPLSPGVRMTSFFDMKKGIPAAIALRKSK